MRTIGKRELLIFNMFANYCCVFHTRQLEFANFSLSCEGRLRVCFLPIVDCLLSLFSQSSGRVGSIFSRLRESGFPKERGRTKRLEIEPSARANHENKLGAIKRANEPRGNWGRGGRKSLFRFSSRLFSSGPIGSLSFTRSVDHRVCTCSPARPSRE